MSVNARAMVCAVAAVVLAAVVSTVMAGRAMAAEVTAGGGTVHYAGEPYNNSALTIWRDGGSVVIRQVPEEWHMTSADDSCFWYEIALKYEQMTCPLAGATRLDLTLLDGTDTVVVHGDIGIPVVTDGAPVTVVGLAGASSTPAAAPAPRPARTRHHVVRRHHAHRTHRAHRA